MMGVRGRGCVFVVSCCCFMFLAVAQTTSPSEVNALSAVKISLNDPMKHLRNWNKGDPCKSNWTGVKCFDTIGNDGQLHVQELQLMNLNLSGSLAPTLGQLFRLEILDFMWNEITGSIPKEIGNITSLKLLLLNGNKLSGSLPEALGYLSNLNRLQVDLNSISGPIPKSFASLDSLQHLHMNNNSISGQIPSELSKLSKLLHLLLDNNNLSGYLPPEFESFPDLRILSLRNCSLQGTVPDLSRIHKLSYLDLSFNQLTGSIPSHKLSDNMTTIDLSDNHLNGSIPGSFSDLPSLQRLSLENNFLIGSVPANIWSNMSFNTTTRLTLDLRNNSLSSIFGDLNPPENVTLRLRGNPICNNLIIRNIGQFCGSEAGGDETPKSSSNSTMMCPIQACPEDFVIQYVPASPVPCFCALPLRIGYQLKSPSFSYFPPYEYPFEKYLTSALGLDLHQLSIDSFVWEEGPRLRMYLKLFPVSNGNDTKFNTSEIQRIRGRFTSWDFNGSDFFGPYELLNFTLLGIYSNTVSETRRESISKGILAAIIGAAACALMVSAIVFLLTARNLAKFKNKLLRKNLFSKISQKIDGVKSFTFREMALATDNFNISTQVGRGGYGRVFKGILSDNTMVAIKRAEQGSLQGQKEFLTEIELLSRLHHRNLVSLVGYCDEEGEQMLVYEFMLKGSLQDWLSAKAKENLNFGMRLRIALGSAKGILYLHTEAQPPVFHRDIKASNILLDSKFTAKVADFGLSRLAPVLDDEGNVPNHVSTVVKGTPGYLDPEYFLTHKLTDKSDVYSLGVVFLELLTGMKPISHGKNIVREVNVAHQSGMMFSIIDSRMGSYPPKCVESFVDLALRCCQDEPEERPSMLAVVRELENILQLMPEIDTTLLESASIHSAKPAPSSSSNVTGQLYVSSNASGSDLVSDVIPTITPH